MNNHMLDLWAQMEAQHSMGIVKRLYDSSIPYHIFATYASDERGYGISFSYPEEIRIDTTPFSNLKKLKVVGSGTTLTKADFNKMSYSEKLKLYNENKALYDQLVAN